MLWSHPCYNWSRYAGVEPTSHDNGASLSPPSAQSRSKCNFPKRKLPRTHDPPQCRQKPAQNSAETPADGAQSASPVLPFRRSRFKQPFFPRSCIIFCLNSSFSRTVLACGHHHIIAYAIFSPCFPACLKKSFSSRNTPIDRIQNSLCIHSVWEDIHMLEPSVNYVVLTW